MTLIRTSLRFLAPTLVVAALSNPALAAIPDATGTYTGCYLKTTTDDTRRGSVRTIDLALGQKCLANEVQITWNARGVAGPQGAIGLTGAQGVAGPQGPAGAIGAQGAMGATGATGATGAQGPAGAPGAQGATGAQGLKGDKGDTGPQGATGAAGPQGAVGATGYRVQPTALGVYDPSCAAGGVSLSIVDANQVIVPGTTTLAICNGTAGAAGAAGAAGVAGAQGVKGDKGDKGDTGPMGPVGPVGPSGSSGFSLATPLFTVHPSCPGPGVMTLTGTCAITVSATVASSQLVSGAYCAPGQGGSYVYDATYSTPSCPANCTPTYLTNPNGCAQVEQVCCTGSRFTANCINPVPTCLQPTTVTDVSCNCDNTLLGNLVK